MSFFGRLFSSPDVIEKSVDAVIKSGDMLVFTDEEKSVAAQKTLDWLLEFHKASSGSQIARRYIAVMVVLVFLALVIACAVFVGFSHTETAEALLGLITDTLVWPVSVIMVFYYGAGMVKDTYKK